MILLGILFCLIPAILFIVMSPKLYNATTSILVDPRQGRSLSIDVAGNNLSSDTAQMESQIKLVSSQTVLKRVVEVEKLLNDPEFGVPAPGFFGRILSVVLGSVPQSSKNDRVAVSVDALAKNISIKRPERTYVIDIQMSSQEAEKAARLANAVAKAYMDDSVDSRNQAVNFESEWVRDRLVDLRDKLKNAEARVEDYKEQNKIFDAGGKLVNDEQINNVSNEIVLARTKTAETRARFDQIQRLMRSGKGLDSLGEAQKSGALEKLRTQAADIGRLEANLRTTLGPRHPQYQEVQQQAADTKALINQELARIASATEADYQVAKTGEASLEKELERLKAISATTNLSRPKLRELEREVEAQRAAFEKFTKIRDSIQQQGIDTPVARIIAPASVPDAPSSPRKVPILALALAAGAGLGMALALVAESLSRRRDGQPQQRPVDGISSIAPATKNKPASAGQSRKKGWLSWFSKSPNDAPRDAAQGRAYFHPHTFIPAFQQPYSTSELDIVNNQPESPFTLAVLELCFSILQKAKIENRSSRGPVYVVLTSLENGAGKTTLAGNLGQAAAAAGVRTLLVDADTATARLSFYGIDRGTPGLISIMGRPRLAFSMRMGASDIGKNGHLFVLPATEGGQATSSRLPQVLPQLLRGELEQNFDLVLIDSGIAGGTLSAADFTRSIDQVLLVCSDPGVDVAALKLVASALAVDANSITTIAMGGSRQAKAA